MTHSTQQKESQMKTLHAVSAAALVSACLGAWAHGHADHSHRKAEPVRKEQKDWGIAAEAREARRTIVITMSDSMRFTPDRIEVKQGETVKLVVRNSGKVLHELVLGTRKELEEHAALMLKFPNMEHDEPYMAHVAPAKARDLVWTFNRAGEFEFACLVPGHYGAGMIGKVIVAPADGKAGQLKGPQIRTGN
jgi:uncharacterized cupredoxin-like copper-binding protein